MVGLSLWFSGKEFTCQCRKPGFDPWVGKMPWRRAWQPTLVFWPGEAQRPRILVGHSPQHRKEADMTKVTEVACIYLADYLLLCLFVFLSFLTWTIFQKYLLNLLQYCFYFMFWFFGCETCGILAPRPRIEPRLSSLEDEVLNTGPPGKSLFSYVLKSLKIRTTS